MNTIKINKQNTKLVAHRGLSYLEKENTLSSFIAASNRSYFASECDIHPTIDGYFVICHDENLKRVSGIDINVEKTTLEKIREIDLFDINNEITSNINKVPLLEEYIVVSKKYEKNCVIEFKNLFTKNDIHKVLDIVKKYNYLDKSIFISFHMNNLKIVKEYNKNIDVQLLLEKYDDEMICKMIDEKMDLDIYYKELNEERLNFLHSKNVKVNVWTVNDKDEAEELCKIGVDYITTDILE